jgi:beta-lactamase class A
MLLDSSVRQEGRHYRSSLRWRRHLALSWGAVALAILANVTFATVPSGPSSWSDSPVAKAATVAKAAMGALPASAAEARGMATAAIPEGLQGSIDRILGGAEGYRVGVALAAVGGETRTYGDDSAFVAASTAKLITAAAYYHLVETGEATLEQEWGDYNAAFQLEAMIKTSNNDSWLLLMDAVGYPDLIQYAASIGITYDPQENRLTPSEMALFLKQLYSGDLLSPEDTEQLLSYMQNTNVEDFIPAASGPDIMVHHKYGQLDGNLHDVALLSFRDTTYALVIYTESADGTDEAGRIEMIHTLTGTIVDALFPLSPPAR